MKRHEARKRVQMNMKAYMEEEQNGIFNPLPNTGKTTGFIKNIADLDRKGAILQPNRDLRREAAERAETEGLSYVDIPSFHEASPLMDEDSQYYDPRAELWRDRGMPPRMIYEILEPEIPLAEDDYQRALDDDWEDVDLIIGDPFHLNLPAVSRDRIVAIDDIDPVQRFSEQIIIDPEHRNYSPRPELEIQEYLSKHNFDVRTTEELIQTTSGSVRRRAMQNPSIDDIPDTQHVRARTSTLVEAATRLTAHDVRTTWNDYDDVANGVKRVVTHVEGALTLVSIPLSIKNADAIFVLGATVKEPVITQFFQDIEEDVVIDGLLDGKENEFLIEQNYHIVQVSERLHSRHNNRQNSKRRERLVDWVEQETGQDPVVFDSRRKLTDNPEWKPTSDKCNFSRAIGTNKYEHETAAVIPGTTHYGDDYVKRQAAYCDVDADVVREDGQEGEWQDDTSVAIYEHMIQAPVFQALMRIGRARPEAKKFIVVDTHAIPDWVPRLRPNDGIVDTMFRDDKPLRKLIYETLDDRSLTAKQIYEKQQMELNNPRSLRTVYRELKDMLEDGLVDKAGEGHYNADEWEALTADSSTISIVKRQKFVVDRGSSRQDFDYYTGHEPLKVPDRGTGPLQLDLGQF